MDESFLVSLFENKSLCKTLHMKMSLIYTKMKLQAGVIRMVSHLDSF